MTFGASICKKKFSKSILVSSNFFEHLVFEKKSFLANFVTCPQFVYNLFIHS